MHLIHQCDGALVGLRAGVVPTLRVAMDTSLLALKSPKPPHQLSRHQLPNLSNDDEFNFEIKLLKDNKKFTLPEP